MTPYSFAGFPEEIQRLASNKTLDIGRDLFELDLDSILRKSCKITGANYNDLTGGSRKRECAEAKRLFCFFVKRHTQMSLTKIGQFLKINHATVLHHVRKFKDLVEVNDPIISGYLSQLRAANTNLPNKYRKYL